MATLIKTDGSKLEIQPQNGLGFQLDELQKFVDGYIDIINLHNGDIDMSNAYRKLTGKRGFFNQCYLYEDKICNTLTAHADSTIPFNKPVYLSKSEVCNASTFPQDYDFCGFSPHYICGMSVPPVMMAQVATRVYEQWLSKL